MTERSVTHATFVVERVYPARPARVFAAWADAKAKARWFGPPEEGVDEYTLDFRIGGREWSRAATRMAARPTPTTRATTTSCRTRASSPPTRCTSTARAFPSRLALSN